MNLRAFGTSYIYWIEFTETPSKFQNRIFFLFQMTSFLEKTIGVHGMFTSFGFICILFAVIAYKLVPETHGKSYRDSVLVKSPLEKETTSPLHQLQV